jgi:hypothetical protein
MIKFKDLHDTMEAVPRGTTYEAKADSLNKVLVTKDEEIKVEFYAEGMKSGTLYTPSYKFASKMINAFFTRYSGAKISPYLMKVETDG